MSDDRDSETPGIIDHKQEDDSLSGIVRDEGVPGELREEMFENARLYNMREATDMTNVNDEPGFDDGTYGSISDGSVVTGDGPQDSTARLAAPNNDAGGEVKGPRVGGSGAVDGGPPRTRPLPGDKQD